MDIPLPPHPADVPPGPPSNKPSRRITTLGDYQLGAKIGAGTMGAVYRAWQLSHDRPAAVKVLRPHLAKNRLFLERFRREADVLARLSHPNIVRCYGLGKQHGRHYIGMELVEGVSLGDWLYQLGQLSIGEAVHIALACARALQHAHQNGLIHRDVKPDNILITRDGAVKLADLGLAKSVLEEDSAATEADRGAGTPVYMAPEQARRDSEPDPRSDLYALGCVLYHMLTGQVPFRGASSLDVILAKVEGNHTPARERNPEVPAALGAVLSLLLMPHPDERYQSATDVVNELEELELAAEELRFPCELGAFTSDVPRPTTTPTDLTTVPEEKLWYVLLPTVEGQWITKQYSTTEVLKGMQDRHFATRAQISHHKGDYHYLAEFPEFKAALDLATGRWADLQESTPTPTAQGRRKTLRRLLVSAIFLMVGILGFWLGLRLVR